MANVMNEAGELVPDESDKQNAETLYRHKAHAECQRLLYAAEQALNLAMAALERQPRLYFGVDGCIEKIVGSWLVYNDGVAVGEDGRDYVAGEGRLPADFECPTFAEAWRRALLVMDRPEEKAT